MELDTSEGLFRTVHYSSPVLQNPLTALSACEDLARSASASEFFLYSLDASDARRARHALCHDPVHARYD